MKHFLAILILFSSMLICSCEDDPILQPESGDKPKGSYGKINLLDLRGEDTITDGAVHVARNPELF